MPTDSVGVVIITHRARHQIDRCLAPLLASPLKARILVVNSSSGDGTVERAEALGAETWVIPRREFNHGRTRELARQRLGTDIAVMLTPDAHATDEGFLERLVAPVAQGEAAVSYGRQLPRREADRLERFNRLYNYPATSQLRSHAERARYGGYTHFCSNSCAAWSNAELDRIGGFRKTLVSEETIAVCELLERGRKIAYVADATVVHSHPSSLMADFRRQFDVGFTREHFKAVLLRHGADERRGLDYLRNLLATLREENPALLPYALLNTVVRYAGYRCGRLGPLLPRAICARLSGQDFFWQGRDALEAEQARAGLGAG